MPAAACSGPLSTLDPAGPSAESIALLWWVMLAGAAVIFAIVMVILAVAFWRRDRETSISERNWLLTGIVFPTVALSALLVFALAFGEYLLPRPAPDVLRVDAQAQRYSWRFSSPDRPDAATVNTLRIPVGRPVDIHVTSVDVIHSFWIPRLGGKIDAIPGHTNVIRLMASVPGTYRGQCAEFCGAAHANMFFIVDAVPAEEFAAAPEAAR